jgi:hypothetical protein
LLGANQEEAEEMRLPAPEQPLLTRLSEPELAELIESYIDYVDDKGRSVHLGSAFVHHFHTRDDNALPLAVAVSTLPIVLGDGTLLAGMGLNRERGILFRVPPELLRLPQETSSTQPAILSLPPIASRISGAIDLDRREHPLLGGDQRPDQPAVSGVSHPLRTLRQRLQQVRLDAQLDADLLSFLESLPLAPPLRLLQNEPCGCR